MRGNGRPGWLELACFCVGTAAALLFCFLSLRGIVRITPQVSAHPSVDGDVFPSGTIERTYVAETTALPDGSEIGELNIPELNLKAPVVEGVTDSDLQKGVGHITGSAASGGLGNVVLAAHRDGVFRALRGIKRGMEIRLTGKEGTFHYQADSTKVVTPEHLEVMAIGNTPSLTLVTCYPFSFIGAAPERFIVTAHLVSVTPDANDPRVTRLP